MSGKLDEIRETVDHEVSKLDAYVAARDEDLRQRFGVKTLLARALDISAIVVGLVLIALFGILAKIVGVILVMGGLFGFLYTPPGTEGGDDL